MSGAMLWGWDRAASDWVKVLVNPLGYLQTVVVASALPAGGATAAGQATSNDWLSRINAKLAGGLPAALVAGSLAVVEQGTPAQHCYGFDGGAWQMLRVDTPADAFATPTYALEVMSFLMGYDGGDWNMVRVDASGHLQIDVLTVPTTDVHLYGYGTTAWQTLLTESDAQKNLRTRLYGGANAVFVGQSAAAFAYTNYGLGVFAALYADDGTNLSRVGMLLAGADNVPNTLNTLGVAAMGYAFDGTNWDRLRMEAAAVSNLRVRLFAGANAIDARTLASTNQADATRTLSVQSFPMLSEQAGSRWLEQVNAASIDDTGTGRWHGAAALMGWSGSAYHRLRVYDTGILKVGRAEIDSTTVRKTAAGAVVAGAHNLYWVACSPDSPSAEWELTDAIAGGGTVVYDHFDSDKHSEHLIFDPPMKFATGIWIEKFDHMHSLVFCYV